MWTIPASTGNPLDDMGLAAMTQRLSRSLGSANGATADELRDLAKLLRALSRDIFQGGQNNPSVSAEAERIRFPILNGWYKTPLSFQRNHEQLRLFDKVGGLLGEIASGTADSPCERLESLASDVDKLAPPIVAAAETLREQGDDPPAALLDELTPNQVKIVRYLWPMLHGVDWDSLPNNAFQDGENRDDAAVKRALERLQGKLNELYERFKVRIEISADTRRVKLCKDSQSSADK